jgi:cytoplasmic iron level regulating protein YaaA (DUF328/UPF0246 family)
MKVLLSPAKSLDFDTAVPHAKRSQPLFLDKAAKVNEVLRKKSPKKLMDLMGISPSLADLNYQRNQDWSTNASETQERPAVYAFSGEVYRGLDVYSLAQDRVDFMQNTLRILSGQYGLLRPLDQIMPYRLEMGTKLAIGRAKNLYEFWQKEVTKALASELEPGEIIVNLASNEYAKCVDFGTLNNPVINPVFKEFKNGAYKVLAVYAKHARGLMARFIIESGAKFLEDLMAFSEGGYALSHEMSEGNQLVFTR